MGRPTRGLVHKTTVVMKQYPLCSASLEPEIAAFSNFLIGQMMRSVTILHAFLENNLSSPAVLSLVVAGGMTREVSNSTY